jgi:hypothetical protein
MAKYNIEQVFTKKENIEYMNNNIKICQDNCIYNKGDYW